MKQTSFTYRFLSLAMAALIYVSSVGFTVDMHYCRGQLKSFSLVGKAKSCHEMDAGKKNCPHHKKAQTEKPDSDLEEDKKNCCSNNTLHFQSDQDQQVQAVEFLELNQPLQLFFFAFVKSYLSLEVFESETQISAHYKPPLIPRDIYVLSEAFLL